MLLKSLIIDPKDNVAVLLQDGKKGDSIQCGGDIVLLHDIQFGHKVALVDLPQNSPVLKYGEEIGAVVEDTRKGSWIHNHNMTCDRGK